jgi:hypothetical protein
MIDGRVLVVDHLDVLQRTDQGRAPSAFVNDAPAWPRDSQIRRPTPELRAASARGQEAEARPGACGIDANATAAFLSRGQGAARSERALPRIIRRQFDRIDDQNVHWSRARLQPQSPLFLYSHKQRRRSRRRFSLRVICACWPCEGGHN